MGERYVRNVEVEGSTPFRSTHARALDRHRSRALFFGCQFCSGPSRLAAPVLEIYRGDAESFHSRLRDEFLAVELFSSVSHARECAAAWREDYNNYRPHSSLCGLPPGGVRASLCCFRSGCASTPAAQRSFTCYPTSTLITPGQKTGAVHDTLASGLTIWTYQKLRTTICLSHCELGPLRLIRTSDCTSTVINLRAALSVTHRSIPNKWSR